MATYGLATHRRKPVTYGRSSNKLAGREYDYDIFNENAPAVEAAKPAKPIKRVWDATSPTSAKQTLPGKIVRAHSKKQEVDIFDVPDDDDIPEKGQVGSERSQKPTGRTSRAGSVK